MADQFCLRWNNFQSNIVSALESLKCSEDLVDVTLTCEGRNIKAHKVILSACSPYFRTVFKENPCQHPVIILKDVLAEDIIGLLSYMYQGEVFIEESKLSSFLHTAALLQVKGLTGVTQQNKECFTASASSAPITSNKLYTQLTISSKTSSVTAQKVPKSSPATKKRRSSTSDKPNEVNYFESQKKTKVTEALDSNKNVTSVKVIRSENNTETKDARMNQAVNTNGNTPSAQFTHLSKEPITVTVKTEISDEEDHEGTLTGAEKENESLPDYENSMLARSLLSGINPSKSDINANNSSPKSKMPQKIDPILPTRPREITNTSVFSKKSPPKVSPVPEDQIKSERQSPKVDTDFEPEILISEQGENCDTYTQDQSQALLLLAAGMPLSTQGASTSQGLAHIMSNHAAICGDCPHCGMKYSNQSALKYHVRLMHSDLTNRLCCYLCPSSFTMRETYKEHMLTTHGQRS